VDDILKREIKRAVLQELLSTLGISPILYHIWEDAGQSLNLLDQKQLMSPIILISAGQVRFPKMFPSPLMCIKSLKLTKTT